VKIKWKHGALYKIRKLPGVISGLEAWAEQIAADANSMGGTDGYKTSSVQGKRRPQGRWRTTVITATAEAMADNMKHNTLSKAFDG